MSSVQASFREDPRLRDAAVSHFPRSPCLVDFLVDEVRRLEGGLEVMRLVCRLVTELRVGVPPPPESGRLLEMWRGDLSPAETERLSGQLLTRFPNLLMAETLCALRLRSEFVVVENEGTKQLKARPRSSVNQARLVDYLCLVHRVLAVVEGLER